MVKNGEFIGELVGKIGFILYMNVKGVMRDVWFVGYMSDVVGSVWMGYDFIND